MLLFYQIANLGNVFKIRRSFEALIPRFLSDYINFSKIHSKAMLGLFEGFEKYLSTI